VTVVPASGLSGNQFLSAVAFQVPAGGLPGGIKNVDWSGRFYSATPGLDMQWQWGAAVYTSFNTNYNALGVKPVDDNSTSIYHNSDHAGTPENYKSSVTGGATGGGGSNYTGSLSGTNSETPTTCQACAGGNYSFIVTGIDSRQTGAPPGGDKFRIKIYNSVTNVVIYDNNMGSPDVADPTTPLGGGDIQIHK
jgi:hypothetical protein